MEPVWLQGVTGRGVVVTVVDDGEHIITVLFNHNRVTCVWGWGDESLLVGRELPASQAAVIIHSLPHRN